MIDALPLRQFLVVMGVAIGIIAGIVLVRVLHSLLFGMEPSDPAIYALATFLVSFVANRRMLHSGSPRNKIEPSTGLHYEGLGKNVCLRNLHFQQMTMSENRQSVLSVNEKIDSWNRPIERYAIVPYRAGIPVLTA
jgi:hypothetical protein